MLLGKRIDKILDLDKMSLKEPEYKRFKEFEVWKERMSQAGKEDESAAAKSIGIQVQMRSEKQEGNLIQFSFKSIFKYCNDQQIQSDGA